MGYWNLSLCEMSYSILFFATTVKDVKNFQKKCLQVGMCGNVRECVGMRLLVTTVFPSIMKLHIVYVVMELWKIHILV